MNNFEKRLNEYKKLINLEKTTKEITNNLKISTRSINNYAKKLKIKPKRQNRNKFNIDFFEKIDTEEKAYMLGFISADGYISSNNRTLCFRISKKDIDIIEKFNKLIDFKNNIIYKENTIDINYCSIKMVKDLEKYGIVRNKTKTVYLPELEDKLIKHFIRGYIDGDGCIGKKQVSIIFGSEKMYRDMLKTFEKKSKGKISSLKKDNYYIIQLCRRNCDLIKYLYEDSKIYLDRKKQSYNQNWKFYTERIRTKG